MADEISYEEHVQQNNHRLVSIRQSLADPLLFPTSCAELTRWCSDQRAFNAYFEENLMAALQVAMEHGSKEGFDFNLTHQLIAACFTHRKHLSKESAARINRWYEQMRRLKKNGGRRRRKAAADSVGAVAGQLVQQQQQQHQQQQQQQTAAALVAVIDPIQMEHLVVTDSGTMWSGGSQLAGSTVQPQQPSPSHQPQMNYVMQGQQQYGNMYPSDASQLRPSYPTAMPPMEPGMNYPSLQPSLNIAQSTQQLQPLSQPQQQQQPIPAQSKSTAKAKRNRQNNANSQNSGNSGNIAATVQQVATAAAAQPQNLFDHQQTYSAMPLGGNTMPGHPQPYMHYPSGMISAPGQSPMSNMPMGYQQTSAMQPSPVFGGQTSAVGCSQMIRAGPPVMFHQMAGAGRGQPSQVAAYANPYNLPSYVMQPVSLIPFPIQPIVPAFTLVHEQVYCTQQFMVSPEIMQRLQIETMDVILRSFHRPKDEKNWQPSDRLRVTKWPTVNNEICVQFLLNNTNIPLKEASRSVSVKSLIKQGHNELTIQQYGCACDHYFSLTLVNRLPLPQASATIINNYSHIHPLMRIKRNKDRLLEIARRSSQPCLRLPLNSLNSARRLSTPARHNDCPSTLCFELEMALLSLQEADFAHCPFCASLFCITDLDIDFYVGSLLTETKLMQPAVFEVSIDTMTGMHTPIVGRQQLPASAVSNQAKLRDAGGLSLDGSCMRKRASEDVITSASFPIKRIRSEQCVALKQEATSFSSAADPHSPFPLSVPNGLPFGQSPANLMSPHGNTSPQKLAACEVVAAPLTPSHSVAAPMADCAVLPSTSSTSPNGPHANHGSIEQASLNGSAPYTPSSVGSHAHSGIAQGIELCRVTQTADNVLNNLDASDLLKVDNTFDHSQFVRYLKDTSLEEGKGGNEQRAAGQQPDCALSLPEDSSVIWSDVLDIIRADTANVSS